jgi:hypothetical protein
MVRSRTAVLIHRMEGTSQRGNEEETINGTDYDLYNNRLNSTLFYTTPPNCFRIEKRFPRVLSIQAIWSCSLPGKRGRPVTACCYAGPGWSSDLQILITLVIPSDSNSLRTISMITPSRPAYMSSTDVWLPSPRISQSY